MITKIEKAIKEKFGYSFAELSTQSRKRIYSEPRLIAMYLLRKYTELTHSAIAKFFNRKHADCVYACNLVRELVVIDYKYTKIIKELEDKLKDK
jgi:chromosomal replication initiation ATPase DnaA